MDITDELRSFIKDPLLGYASQEQHVEQLTAIADRIDAAHEEALREAYTKGREDGMGMANNADMQAEYLRGKNDGYDEGWDAGFASADDWCAQHEGAMAEHGWVRLPKDADGEYIHVGDELRDEWNELNQGEVNWLMLDHHGWWLKLKSSCDRFYVHEFHEWRHHKQPTVEDTLREFAERWLHTADGSEREDAVVAEYAAKLRLRGDAE